jgi:FkbM family methyltransferase
MVGLTYLLPVGLVRLLEYARRFRALNLPPCFSLVQRYRLALVESQLELVPSEQIASLKCVVDVGANLGSWCTGVACLTGAERIIAYEPVPDVFNRLCENAKKYPQIRCVQAAVGSSLGRVTVNVETAHELSSVLAMRSDMRCEYGAGQDRSRQVEVPMTTLDEDLKEEDEISLLKVDVQGYEREVFAGARSVLRRTKVLMTEVLFASHYEGDLQFGDLCQLIQSTSHLNLWAVSKPSCSPSGRALWADAVFVQDVSSGSTAYSCRTAGISRVTPRQTQ